MRVRLRWEKNGGYNEAPLPHVEREPEQAPLLLDEEGAMERTVFSVPEAAELLGVSATTLRHEIRAGRLLVFRIRGCVRVSQRAIDEYVALMEEEARLLSGTRRVHAAAYALVDKVGRTGGALPKKPR